MRLALIALTLCITSASYAWPWESDDPWHWEPPKNLRPYANKHEVVKDLKESARLAHQCQWASCQNKNSRTREPFPSCVKHYKAHRDYIARAAITEADHSKEKDVKYYIDKINEYDRNICD